MRSSLRVPMLRAIGVAALFALSGCAFQSQLERIAVDQNQVVASAADSLTLLNILRAKKFRPVHFTSISRISGNVDLDASGSVGAGITVAGGNNANVAPGARVGISTRPSFDMTVHDSQSFQRGIMQPISPDIINYYLHTGWRSDLLTYLLVERIDFVTDKDVTIGDRLFKRGESIETLQNDPSNAALAKQFHDFVACYTLSASQRPGDTMHLAELAKLKPLSLGELALLDGSKFDLGSGPDAKTAASSPDDRSWVVRRTSGGEAVGLVRSTSNACQASGLTLVDGNSLQGRSEPVASSIYPRKTRTFEVAIAGRAMPVTTAIDITFRSVDGVIYFLGEYLRGSDDTRVSYHIMTPNGDVELLEPLLLVRPGAGGAHDLSAQLEGESFHIPASPPSRSFQVIALIEQLFNLHKSGSGAPLSTAVRVVN